MKFVVTGEITDDALRSFLTVEQLLIRAFESIASDSALGKLDATVHFCPIVMNEEFREFYPARSRLSKKDRTYHCSPQLNHEFFLSSDTNLALRHCVEALFESVDPLVKLGATDEQVQEFRGVLDALMIGHP